MNTIKQLINNCRN